jgi:hypothetical protein
MSGSMVDPTCDGDLYRDCLTQLSTHTGVNLTPHALYSPATVDRRR